MGQIKIITCPKYGAEIRREKPGHAFFRYGPPAGEFWLKFSDELFTHPSYEAREPGAVECVVRRILSHYGVNGNNITVQTEYRSKDLKNENGTLGSLPRSAGTEASSKPCICLMKGLGGEKDEARGRAFLCQAAALGSRDAARILGA